MPLFQDVPSLILHAPSQMSKHFRMKSDYKAVNPSVTSNLLGIRILLSNFLNTINSRSSLRVKHLRLKTTQNNRQN
jgi:hypothetical protein